MTDITIVATTYLPPGNEWARTEAFARALRSWQRLHYDDGAIRLHIADDGSDDPEPLCEAANATGWGDHSFSRQIARGVGASLNAGLTVSGDLILHAVDDWHLDGTLDLTPWVRLLMDRWEDVGLVRFFPHPSLTLRTVPSPAGWAAFVKPGDGYGFGFRPFLAHRRFFETVGPFRVDCSSMEAERDYNERWSEPTIIQAIHTPTWTPLETGSLADVDPRDRKGIGFES